GLVLHGHVPDQRGGGRDPGAGGDPRRTALKGEHRHPPMIHQRAVPPQQHLKRTARRESLMADAGVAVVTGAGSGLGREIARALLAEGWRVAAAGRRPDPLTETIASAGGGQALAHPTDVTSDESVQALFEAVRDRW